MPAESPSDLILPIGIALATGGAVLLLAGGADGAAVAAVGGVVAVLARGRDRPGPAAPPSQPAPTRIDLVLDAVAEPVLLLRGGRVAIANRAARTLLGAHVVGEDARVAIRHPAAAEALVAATGQPVLLGGLATRDALWEMRVAPIDDDGRVLHLVNRSDSVAAERMRVDFVANASHELRTPLASIIGYAETLAEDAGDEPAIRRRFLGIVRDEARRMQRLVEDLLSLSRIEADKYRIPETPLQIDDIVAEVCAEIAASGDPRAADLSCPEPGELPPIAGDRAQISQLLHNLLGNAMKYGRPGTPVRVGLAVEGTRLRITVSDEGDGIAPDHLPRLTERFYRVDAGRSRALGGTGLGLAIVKHIAERHRGRLDVASRVGQGTTVSVTLPIMTSATAGVVIKA